ncbi:MAG: ROK family protein, partial [Clostridia bacterium]|nr:ROK family protein [Clostridia bacterium]
MSQYYLGVDIGGTKIALVKGDEEGRILEKIRFDNNGSPEEMIERILSSAASFGAVSGVGISCGGP